MPTRWLANLIVAAVAGVVFGVIYLVQVVAAWLTGQ